MEKTGNSVGGGGKSAGDKNAPRRTAMKKAKKKGSLLCCKASPPELLEDPAEEGSKGGRERGREGERHTVHVSWAYVPVNATLVSLSLSHC